MVPRLVIAAASLLRQRAACGASAQSATLRQLPALGSLLAAQSFQADPPPGSHSALPCWAVLASTGGAFALYSTATGSNVARADAEPLAKVGIAPQPPEEDSKGKKKGPPPDRYERPKALKGLPREVILYQYEVCPFCCKTKAVLDYYKIPYRAVEVSPLFKTELKWSGKTHVPLVMLDDEMVTDSSVVVSRVAAEAEAAKQAAQQPQKKGWFGGSTTTGTASPPSAEFSQEEERWRRWVDDRFVRVITINIYRNAKESFQTFEYITEHGNFSWFEREAARYVGAAMMWALSGRLKKKYKIEGEPREELYACADEWLAALGDRKFLGGEQPNLADLSVFGVIRSVTGTDTFMDLMHNTSIGKWYEQMMAAVGPSSRLS